MVLVIGATGQLGFQIVKQLLAKGHKVKTLVRPTSEYTDLAKAGVELAFGDLKDKTSVGKAFDDVDTVIATANVVVPRVKASFKEDEGQGYTNLVEVCQHHDIKQFIFISVPVTPVDKVIDTQYYKRQVEQHLQESKLNYTIFRGSIFMDVWFSLVGSPLNQASTEHFSLGRKFWFANGFYRIARDMMNRGFALIPGTGKARHAFITEADVAHIMVNSVGQPQAYRQIYELGGPEVLTWDEVVTMHSQIMKRKVRPLHTPAVVFRVGSAALKPFSRPAANLLGLNMVAANDTNYDSGKLAAFIERPLTTVEEFLQQRIKSTSRK